jgi:hypothetical protein
MRRNLLVAICLTFLLAGALGCGSSNVPPAEERPGVESRKNMQKEKAQKTYMKPEEK